MKKDEADAAMSSVLGEVMMAGFKMEARMAATKVSTAISWHPPASSLMGSVVTVALVGGPREWDGEPRGSPDGSGILVGQRAGAGGPRGPGEPYEAVDDRDADGSLPRIVV